MSLSQLQVVTVEQKENKGTAAGERFVDNTQKAAASDDKNLKFTLDQFEKAFQTQPKYVARAPGRVNIIGEHIDYNGFGVLPMALEQSIFVACNSSRIDDGIQLELHSTSPGAKACKHVCNLSEMSSDYKLSPPFEEANKRAWSHYVLCALYGVLEALSVDVWKKLNGQKLCLLVHGTIPQGAGLSSSSALVVASALAFLSMFEELPHFNKTQIASLCARCERWVGTEGGGMDQAVSLFAEEGSARYIQFNPTLSHSAIPLPESVSWVVCHSLEECHKRGSSATQFNKRVVECKLGCRLLAQLLDWREHHDNGLPETLWELLGKTGMPLGKLERMVRDSLKNVYTKKDILALILGENLSPESEQIEELVHELGISREAGKEALTSSDSFHIRDRLLHVLTETERVQEFVSLCIGAPSEETQSSLLHDLGSLLNQSHKSCSQMYDCSSSQVNKLQEICAIGPGAVGARMTGAGWGGSVICMVESKEVDAFCTHVRKRYYERFIELPKQESESDYMFVTEPAQGSNVFVV